jgi:hypothetical protein
VKPRNNHLRAIEQLVAKRRACIEAADLADLELGRALDEHCQEFSVSTGQLAGRLQMSPALVAELGSLSQGRLTALNGDGTVPSMSYSRIPDMIERYGRVSRVIGHVGSGLVLHESRLGLKAFYCDAGCHRRYIFCERMLIRFGDDAWAQIKGVQYGYGGSGPSDAYRALRLAGVPEESADAVFSSNGVNYVIEDDGSVQSRDFGATPPQTPELATDGSLVVTIRGSRWDENGDVALRAWVAYLAKDDISLPWNNGERRISIYPSRVRAERDGFDSSYDGIPQMIIEQGDLQIWLIEFVEDDPAVWIPKQFRRYLEVLNALPEDILAADDASPFRRWLASHSHRRPSVIGLGAGKVTRVPRLRGV